MTEFLNAYKMVSHSEMDDLAIQIIEEWDDQDTAEMNRLGLLRSMYAAQISPHSTCPERKTLGFYLAREMSLAVLTAYQEVGGNLTDRDNQGNTLLFEALSGFSVFLGNDYDTSCIDFLIQSGLDINQPNSLGETPIFAVHRALRHPDVRRIIQSEGHEKDFERRYEEYISLLMLAQSKGADLRHRCNKGFDVFDAREHSFDALHQYMSAYKSSMEKSILHDNIQRMNAVDPIVPPRTRKI